MAKDKGKKDKAEKVTEEEAPKKAKGGKDKGGAPQFVKPSEAPSGGDGWQLTDEDHLGELFLIRPKAKEQIDDKFKPGEKKEIIVADITHINVKKPAKSEVHEDVWVFQGWLKGALRGIVGTGEPLLARLAKSDKKDRGNYPWIFEDASEADYEAAREYLASVDPFATGK